MRAIGLTFLLSALATLGACAQLESMTKGQTAAGVPVPTAPRVTVGEVTLVQVPKAITVAKALCPKVASGPVCMVLGSPDRNDEKFVFSVALDLANDNAIPLPLVEALVGFTAFPAATAQNLGAVCISMCDDPNNCPQSTMTAQQCTGGNQVRTAKDFANAAAGFLLAVATGQEKLDNLKVKTIAAHGTTRVVLQLALDPDIMISLVSQLAGQALDSVKRGQTPEFVIPYKVEGTVWVNVEHFGKIAAGFGPFAGSWVIK